MPDVSSGLTLGVLIRWLHFLFGITWIGLLYYLNLVNVRFAASLEASIRPTVVPPLLSRVLAWFRHAAWLTVLAGLILFGIEYMGSAGIDWNNARTQTIALGGLLGIIMAINVWVLIWPNQKKIIAAMRAGQGPDPSWGRTALYASRANFTMSFPMLLFMGHSSGFGLVNSIIYGIIAAVIGFVLVLTIQKWWAPRF
jgi:uncharacterized membrane protein